MSTYQKQFELIDVILAEIYYRNMIYNTAYIFAINNTHTACDYSIIWIIINSNRIRYKQEKLSS